MDSISFDDFNIQSKPVATNKIELNFNIQHETFILYRDLYLMLNNFLRENIVLKGNILLNTYLPNQARLTEDLDMGILSEELYNSKVKPLLGNFGEYLIENGKIDFYTIKEIEPRRSGGIECKKGDTTVYSVDISLLEPLQYSIDTTVVDGQECRVASVEKILSDKIMSTLSRKRFRRVKDLFDLKIILDNIKEYDITKVVSIIKEKYTQEEIELLFNNHPFNDIVIENLHHAYKKLNITSFTHNEIDENFKPDFYEAIETVNIFVNDLKENFYD